MGKITTLKREKAGFLNSTNSTKKAVFSGVRALPLSCYNDKGFLLYDDTIFRGQGSIFKTKETKEISIKRKG